MEVTTALVKELRERTQAGMMDCKKALLATDGNIEKAVEYLREKGLSAAVKMQAALPPKAWLTAISIWAARSACWSK